MVPEGKSGFGIHIIFFGVSATSGKGTCCEGDTDLPRSVVICDSRCAAPVKCAGPWMRVDPSFATARHEPDSQCRNRQKYVLCERVWAQSNWSETNNEFLHRQDVTEKEITFDSADRCNHSSPYRSHT